jgi:hypothetical protein
MIVNIIMPYLQIVVFLGSLNIRGETIYNACNELYLAGIHGRAIDKIIYMRHNCLNITKKR